MDRSIYVSMTGVKHLFDQQAASANNLANASTTGFKAQIDAFHTVGVEGDGSPTRAYVMASATVSYTHLTLPTKEDECRSRWSPYH